MMKSRRILSLIILICMGICPVLSISGGMETTIERQPHMASLLFMEDNSYVPFCGATIVTTRHLLSTRTCVRTTSGRRRWARVGSTSYHSGGQLLEFFDHLPYPDKQVDVGLVVLGQGSDIRLGPTLPGVALVRLASEQQVAPAVGSDVTVVGWDNDDTTGFNVRAAQLKVVADVACFGIYDEMTDDHFCVDNDESSMYKKADLGGPAMQNGTQIAIIVQEDRIEGAPSIYIKVSTVRAWIRSVTNV